MFKINDDLYIRHRSLTNRAFESENFHIRWNFSKIDEMRISFCSCRKLMPYKFYITQPMQAIERKLNQNLAKSPEFLKFINIFFIPSPYVQKYAHLCSD